MLERSERALFAVSGTEAAEYLQGQLTNDVEALSAGRGLLRGAARPQGPHAGRHAGAAHAPTRCWLDTEAIAGDAVLRHLSMYKIGRDVDDRRGHRRPDGDLGDRPGRGRGRARRAGRPRARPPRLRPSAASSASRSRTDLGVDLIAPRAERVEVLAALADAGAEPVGEEAAEIVAGRGRPPALRARDDDRDDPPGGGDQRARRELHQGLLHRPGDGRPPALQGQAEPPPARPAARARRSPPAIPCAWASASSGRSGPPSSPPPAARSRSRSCAARPSRAPRSQVGERRRGRGRRASVLGARSDTGRPHVELGLRARWAHGGG